MDGLDLRINELAKVISHHLVESIPELDEKTINGHSVVVAELLIRSLVIDFKFKLSGSMSKEVGHIYSVKVV